MLQLELTAEEAELLREIAEEWLSDLRVEISATDRVTYRQGLKKKAALLRGIVDRLGAPAA